METINQLIEAIIKYSVSIDQNTGVIMDNSLQDDAYVLGTKKEIGTSLARLHFTPLFLIKMYQDACRLLGIPETSESFEYNGYTVYLKNINYCDTGYPNGRTQIFLTKKL